MTKEQITKDVIELATVHFRTQDGIISEDTHFLDDLGADSLDAAELVMIFEEKYNFPRTKDEEVYSRLLTVRSCVEFIEEKLNEKCKEEL